MDPIKTLIRRPVFTSMLVLSIVVFGLFAYPKIGVDQFPEVEFPVVTVSTVLPGADPETMEKNVTEPLEEALNTLSGLDTLRSAARNGATVMNYLKFKNASHATDGPGWVCELEDQLSLAVHQARAAARLFVE